VRPVRNSCKGSNASHIHSVGRDFAATSVKTCSSSTMLRVKGHPTTREKGEFVNGGEALQNQQPPPTAQPKLMNVIQNHA
jgi:hypothetical protein